MVIRVCAKLVSRKRSHTNEVTWKHTVVGRAASRRRDCSDHTCAVGKYGISRDVHGLGAVIQFSPKPAQSEHVGTERGRRTAQTARQPIAKIRVRLPDFAESSRAWTCIHITDQVAEQYGETNFPCSELTMTTGANHEGDHRIQLYSSYENADEVLAKAERLLQQVEQFRDILLRTKHEKDVDLGTFYNSVLKEHKLLTRVKSILSSDVSFFN